MGEHRGGPRGLPHSAIIVMIVVLALGLVTAWSVLIPGFLDWHDMVLAVIGSLRLTGPVAAVLAAWVAVRRRRAGADHVRTPWRAVRAPLGIIAVVTSSFGVTVLALQMRAVLAGQPGRLLPGCLAMCLAGLALYVMVGWIAGWLLPVAATPPVAGIGAYALFTLLATGSSWTDRLTLATREPYDLVTEVSTAAFRDHTLWLVGLTTALLLGWVALVTRRILALAAAMIAVLAAGTGAARLVSEPRTVAASERLVYSCQEWPITVCVHPTMRSGLTELAGVFTTLAARLAGTPAAFTRVEQRSTDDGDPAPAGVVVVQLDELGPGQVQRAANAYLDRLVRPCPDPVAAGHRSVVVAWLRGDAPPTGPLPEHRYAAVWFSGLTETQRRDWLRMFYADFVACGLSSRHFGGGVRPSDLVTASPSTINPSTVSPGTISPDPVTPGTAGASRYPATPVPVVTPLPGALPTSPPTGFDPTPQPAPTPSRVPSAGPTGGSSPGSPRVPGLPNRWRRPGLPHGTVAPRPVPRPAFPHAGTSRHARPRPAVPRHRESPQHDRPPSQVRPSRPARPRGTGSPSATIPSWDTGLTGITRPPRQVRPPRETDLSAVSGLLHGLGT